MIDKKTLLTAKILVVDDEEMSNKLLVNILSKEGFTDITTTTDSMKALDLYKQIKPDLLILDLNMPNINGFEIMSELRKIEDGSYLPIIIISADDTPATRFKALESGGKDFLNKPYDHIEVIVRIKNLIEVRMLNNEIRDQNRLLEVKVSERTQELYDTQLDVIQKLARAIEFRDSETGLHIYRMSHYSSCLAAKYGLGGKKCQSILTASPLHDIGKIGIPDRILCKPAKLDTEEWEIMKTHTTIGSEILASGSSMFIEMARQIALTHHEKWDGTGYPNGLKAEEIPLVGRICGLCDVFDALTSRRPYKYAWSFDDAFNEIKRTRGSHFDPNVVDAFVDIQTEIKDIYQKYLDQ